MTATLAMDLKMLKAPCLEKTVFFSHSPKCGRILVKFGVIGLRLNSQPLFWTKFPATPAKAATKAMGRTIFKK